MTIDWVVYVVGLAFLLSWALFFVIDRYSARFAAFYVLLFGYGWIIAFLALYVWWGPLP